MVAAYKTPGVYNEEIPRFPPSIAAVDTAIPAFIGYTEQAIRVSTGDLLLKPTRIESLLQYEQYFGKAQPETGITVTVNEVNGLAVTAAPPAAANRSRYNMYYALQMFYANGGNSCYIVSVGDHSEEAGTDPVKDDLANGLTELEKFDEPTLIVIPEAQALKNIADFGTLMTAALRQCGKLMDRFVIMDVHGGAEKGNDNGPDKPRNMSDPDTQLIPAIGDFRDHLPTENLRYGAAYTPNVETIIDFAYTESSVKITHTGSDGKPGPNSGKTLDALSPGAADKTGVNSQHYELAKAAIRDLPVTLPPSPAIAGVYARVDADRGVWKAPANVSLVGVTRPTIAFSNTENDQMNVDPTAGRSVNAIRPFTGKGTLVWGARTLAGNDLEWRYVNVRRFFIFVEESVKKATEQFVFEPNDANTWVRVQAMIENFLTVQWRAGALQGIKPEHAFYVSVGLGKSMTPVHLLEGQMIVEIGLAVVRPAEFVILHWSHKMAES